MVFRTVHIEESSAFKANLFEGHPAVEIKFWKSFELVAPPFLLCEEVLNLAHTCTVFVLKCGTVRHHLLWDIFPVILN